MPPGPTGAETADCRFRYTPWMRRLPVNVPAVVVLDPSVFCVVETADCCVMYESRVFTPETREDAVDPETMEAESAASHCEGAGGPATADAALLVEQLLGGLTKEQRAVVVLAEFEHRTALEIGQTLGINASTAASRLRLARKKLAESAARIEAFRKWRPR